MTPFGGECGWLLESQSSYLLLLAQCQMPRQLRSRLDPAEAVQQTLLQAHKHQEQFQGENEAQFRAWLRTILKNVFGEELRKYTREQGEGGQEVSLWQALEDSSLRFERFLAADDSTPSQRLMREEQLVRLAAALAGLPEDQQQAVRMHHLEGHSHAEVGRRMGRTKEAVAGLLFRGLRKLRVCLFEPQ